MHTVGAYEAKTHLPEILEKVARGENYIITKHGMPVAQIIPAPALGKTDTKLTIQSLKEFSKGKKLGKANLKSMIREGRRF